MCISGEDADWHVSDNRFPGAQGMSYRALLPPLKTSMGMTHREAFSGSGMDQVGLSHTISSACGRAASGNPGAECCPPALHNAGCHRCSHFLKTHAPGYDVPSNMQRNTIPGGEGAGGMTPHAACILKVRLMKYSSQHLWGCWQLLRYEYCHSCKKSTALPKGLGFSSSFKPLAQKRFLDLLLTAKLKTQELSNKMQSPAKNASAQNREANAALPGQGYEAGTVPVLPGTHRDISPVGQAHLLSQQPLRLKALTVSITSQAGPALQALDPPGGCSTRVTATPAHAGPNSPQHPRYLPGPTRRPRRVGRGGC